VQIIGDLLVFFEGFLPAVAVDADELAVNALGPAAEVVKLAANLLLPSAGRVRCEGEVGIGLFGAVCLFPGTPLSRRIWQSYLRAKVKVASPPADNGRQGELFSIGSTRGSKANGKGSSGIDINP
jgi:hypothetical protein